MRECKQQDQSKPVTGRSVRGRASKTSKIVSSVLAVLLMLALSMTLVACGETKKEEPAPAPAPEPAAAVELQIFAANSLQKALPEVQQLYTQQNPNVTFKETQFLGSGDLVKMLEAEPAAADLLITASKGSMDTADKQGSIDATTRIDMFVNDMVVVTKAGSGITLADLADIKGDSFTKIAIGEPGGVPAGAYANQALNHIGLYSTDTGNEGEYDASIAGKVVQESNVGNVAKLVASGDCQIGFVYTSDVYRYDDLEVIYTIPSDFHKAIVYPGAVIAASSYADDAQGFMDFCLSDPDALAIFQKYGFELKG